MIRLTEQQAAELADQVRATVDAMNRAAAAIRAELERRGYTDAQIAALGRAGRPKKT